MTTQTITRQPATLADVAEAIGELDDRLRWMENAVSRGNDITETVREARTTVKWLGNAVARLASDEEAPVS